MSFPPKYFAKIKPKGIEPLEYEKKKYQKYI